MTKELLQAQVDKKLAKEFRLYLVRTEQTYAGWLRDMISKTLKKGKK